MLLCPLRCSQIPFRSNKPLCLYHTFLTTLGSLQEATRGYPPPFLTASWKHPLYMCQSNPTHLIYILTFPELSPATLSYDYLMDSKNLSAFFLERHYFLNHSAKEQAPDFSSLMVRPLAYQTCVTQPWRLTSLIPSSTSL